MKKLSVLKWKENTQAYIRISRYVYKFKIFITIMIIVVCHYSLKGQVGISSTNTKKIIHKNAILQTFDTDKGLILPKVDSNSYLPYYNPSASDLYDDDSSMKGMIMYNKKDKSIYLYKGTIWENLKTTPISHLDQLSRFVGKDGDTETIVCVLACGGPKSEKYAGTKNTLNNAHIQHNSNYKEFNVTESGLYEISARGVANSGSALSTFEAFLTLQEKKKGDRKFVEIAKSKFKAEDFLGIGGTSNLGTTVNATLYLNPEDKIRIQFGVSGIGVGGGATSVSNEHNRRIREITFRKLD